MPLYTYKCEDCEKTRTDIRCIAERHDGPKCDFCGSPMKLAIDPVVGVVKNPAAPRGSK